VSVLQVLDLAFKRVRSSQIYFRAISACTIGCLFFISVALHFWGAQEIREEWPADFLVTLYGMAWLMVSMDLFLWFGLSVRDDVIDGRNFAALIGVCCGLIAMTLIYIGGSSGEGPSYLENIFSIGLGAVAFFALWLALELAAHVSISVAEERDLASGLRLGGFLFSTGLIFGRALAGDWHSMTGTLHDFWRDGWMVLPLLGLALGAEWLLRPSRSRPFPSGWRAGLIPATVYLALATGWVWQRGAWEGMSK
jgi:hypothetical protein